MARRFKFISDEHLSWAHINAVRERGWELVRVIETPTLGQATDDPDILAYCAQHGYVWITTDERARGHVTDWLRAGRTLPGVIMSTQQRLTPGRLVRFLEKIEAEEDPFTGVLRYPAPEDE